MVLRIACLLSPRACLEPIWMRSKASWMCSNPISCEPSDTAIIAAMLMRLSSSAPENPIVRRESTSRFTSLERRDYDKEKKRFLPSMWSFSGWSRVLRDRVMTLWFSGCVEEYFGSLRRIDRDGWVRGRERASDWWPRWPECLRRRESLRFRWVADWRFDGRIRCCTRNAWDRQHRFRRWTRCREPRRGE